MFISFEQLVILLLLAFILFGPERLPEIAAKLGRWMAKVRQASLEMTQQLNQPPPNPLESPYPGQELTCPQCRRSLGGHDFTYCPHCGHRLQEGPGSLPRGG